MDQVAPQSILIIKTSALGDVVHTYPVIHYLKTHFPDCQIDWVVEKGAAPLVKSHPDIRHTFISDTKKWRKSLFSKTTREEIAEFRRRVGKEDYCLLINLQGNLKSTLLSFSARAKKRVGYSYGTAPESLSALFVDQRIHPPKGQNIRNEYLYFVESLFGLPAPSPMPVRLTLNEKEQEELEGLNLKEGILICPFSAWKNKEVSLESLFKLLLHLSKKEQTLYLLSGNKRERAIAESLSQRTSGLVQLLPLVSLPLLSHVMGKLGKVIACDSLPLHLADTAGAKTLGLFGASSSKKYAPLESLNLQGSCPYGETFEKRCRKLRSCATGDCIKKLPVQTLINFSEKWSS